MNPDLERLIRLQRAESELRRVEAELQEVPRATEFPPFPEGDSPFNSLCDLADPAPANDVAAVSERRVGQHTHQTNVTAAEDQADAAMGHQVSQPAGGVSVDRPVSGL